MDQFISFAGLEASPSPQTADAAVALSYAFNARHDHRGRLVADVMPRLAAQARSPFTVLHVHSSPSFSHLVLYNPQSHTLAWTRTDTPSAESLELHCFNAEEVLQVTTLGNTLVVLTDRSLHYLLWRGEGEGYRYLGDHLPECTLTFGLRGEMVADDEFTITFQSISENDIWKPFTDENRAIISEQVLARVNKFIAEHSLHRGRFIYPFMVRYAYRLFDDSLTMHSPPILMICSSDLAPQVAYSHITGRGSYTSASLRVFAMTHTLDYAAPYPAQVEQLRLWSDIIRSIDVFVSPPIYTYLQSGEVERFAQVDDLSNDCYCVCLHTNQRAPASTLPLRYQRSSMSKLFAFTFNPDSFTYPAGRLMLPRRSEAEVSTDVRQCSRFHLLTSLSLDSLKPMRSPISLPTDYLHSLTERELMTDDYHSHDSLQASWALPYNSRLNLAGVSRSVFGGFAAQSTVCHTDGYVMRYSDAPSTMADAMDTFSITVVLKVDGRDVVVRGPEGHIARNTPLLYVFYPDPAAYRAIVTRSVAGSIVRYDLSLTPHPLLQGACYFSGWNDPEPAEMTIPPLTPLAERLLPLASKVYTSEVSNPFLFTPEGINTVGSGRVIALSPAMAALSQGQFGQFPLYVFTTEGVWALEVDKDGLFSACHPVCRDVCTEPHSVATLDQAVVFVTQRGLMMLQGAKARCISLPLNASTPPFTPLALPRGQRLVALAEITPSELPATTFSEFLAGARLLYDYPRSRVCLYNPAAPYAYSYCLNSGHWSMRPAGWSRTVDTLPTPCVASDTDGSLLALDDEATMRLANQLIVTAPICLSDPLSLKRLSEVTVVGAFDRSHVSMALYGSRQHDSWHLIASSTCGSIRSLHGTPYRAFRLALICTLAPDEYISGAILSFDNISRSQFS